MSENNKIYKFKGRIWIETNNKTILGEGKANLLKRTAELGSLRKASQEMGMSYRQAWYNINKLNKVTGTPLIQLHRGGKKGGIAQITEFGQEILEVFERSQHEFLSFLNSQTIILKQKE